jgi:hypothetical protein
MIVVVRGGICEEHYFVDDLIALDMNIDDLHYKEFTLPGHQG